MKITILLGTTRKDSYSSKIAHFIVDTLRATEHEVFLFDLAAFDAPLFSGDYLREADMTAMQKTMHEQWRTSHLVIIVVPEYHGGMPGSLKNLFDVLAKSDLHNNKVYSCVGVSDGRGGLKAIQALQASLTNLINSTKAKAFFTTKTLTVSHVKDIFNENGQLKNASFSERLQDYLQTILPQAEQWKKED